MNCNEPVGVSVLIRRLFNTVSSSSNRLYLMSRSSDPSVTIIYFTFYIYILFISSVKHIPMCRHTLPRTQIPLINSIEMSIGALFVVFCSTDLTLYSQSTVENQQQTKHNTSMCIACMCVCSAPWTYIFLPVSQFVRSLPKS